MIDTKNDGFVTQVILPLAAILTLTAVFGIGSYTGYRDGKVQGRTEATSSFRQEAIDRGFAEYDSKTAAWRWKNESKD